MTHSIPTDPTAVLHFWFDELTAAQHFAKDAALDAAIAQRFGPTLEAAAQALLDSGAARVQALVLARTPPSEQASTH